MADMEEQDYFKEALSNFTHEAASGGAIRHLADLGYTVKQICERLDFPTSYERVQKTVWEHLLDTGVLLRREPGSEEPKERFTYVKDYNQYGRTSFRKVALSGADTCAQTAPICWKDRHLDIKADFAVYLNEKCSKNGEEASYVSCDFGIRMGEDSRQFQDMLQALDRTGQDYLLGLPWEKAVCYHRLTGQMRRIVSDLYESGRYHGICYFIKTEERVYF